VEAPLLDHIPTATAASPERVARSVALLERRGYAVSPERLAALCLGGPVSVRDVRWAAALGELRIVDGLVVNAATAARAPSISARARDHGAVAATYVAMTQRFVRTLVAVAPFIRSVWIAGSLASGGFRESDDVDLNLVVDDGHRHLAYVAVNVLGLLHALAHRSKPVDDLTRRPVAPRLMTANLILARSQISPLERTDAAMAFELLMSEPVFGADVLDEIVAANPALLDQFPQLAHKPAPHVIAPSPRPALPAWLFPAMLDGAARVLGGAAWRYMQWTRRGHPEALARVAFVRETMRPYTLFDGEAGTR
jgi:hypothetical protein